MRAVSILQLAGEAEGAAQKGESRVRAVGGVPTFTVVKRVLAVLGAGGLRFNVKVLLKHSVLTLKL